MTKSISVACLVLGLLLSVPVLAQSPTPTREIHPSETLVAWDQLKPAKLYQLMYGVELEAHRHLRILGPYYTGSGALIRVVEIDRSDPDTLWYKVELIVIGENRKASYVPGWLNGRDIVAHGAVEQP